MPQLVLVTQLLLIILIVTQIQRLGGLRIRPGAKLRRSRHDVWLGGVAAGIADFISLEPIWVRIAFVLFGFSLIGLGVYLVLWIVIPRED